MSNEDDDPFAAFVELLSILPLLGIFWLTNFVIRQV